MGLMTFMSLNEPFPLCWFIDVPVGACVANVVDGGVAELLDVFELTGELMDVPR